MVKPDLPQRWPKPPTISYYAMAVLSVAVGIIAAELITSLLHAEPIASSMLCAVIFAAWFGGFGPAMLAITLALLAFHYYLVPPINSFTWKHNLFAVAISEVPRLILFSITSLLVAFMISAQRKTTDALRRSGNDLQVAIEDQKRIEAALVQSEMYLTEAQRLNRTGSFGWNVSSGKIFWSDETFRIFQCDRSKKPTLEFVVQRTHPNDRAAVQKTIDDASRTGKDFDHEYRLLMPDGSVKYVHAVARAVRDASGSTEFLGAVTDVTVAREAERKLRRSEAELAHVTRVTMLGELTASISHELNQPLAAVVTAARACRRWLDAGTPNLDEARRAADWIANEGNRAGEVIRRVRALAKKTDVEKVPLDINDTIRQVLALVQGELTHHRVLLRTELAPALPMILGDRVQLQQVIINLVMNGIEAMQPVTDRPRELVIRSGQDETHGVLVSVMDCGVGISAEHADRLFNAFFTTKSSGLGMGLSICRSIIEAHGGQMSAVDNEGPGARFQFALPLHQKDTL